MGRGYLRNLDGVCPAFGLALLHMLLWGRFLVASGYLEGCWATRPCDGIDLTVRRQLQETALMLKMGLKAAMWWLRRNLS